MGPDCAHLGCCQRQGDALLRGHQSSVNSAVFSPDGSRVVTASWDRTARIWDTASGKEIALLRGHQDLVSSAVFSPDGSRVVTASQDKTVRVWNADLTLMSTNDLIVEVCTRRLRGLTKPAGRNASRRLPRRHARNRRPRWRRVRHTSPVALSNVPCWRDSDPLDCT